MPIKGLNDLELAAILNAHLTPSKEILTPERLVGREQCLLQIGRALNSEGRNVFIFGDRGVGKTSVARTAATIHNFAETAHIYVACGESTSFGQIVQAVGNAVIPVSKRLRPRKIAAGGSAGFMGTSIGANFTAEPKPSFDKPASVIEALDVLSFVAESRKGRTVVVVDEFERINDELDKLLFAELIKNLSTRNIDLRFIFSGIGHTVDELLGKHLSRWPLFPTNRTAQAAPRLPVVHHQFSGRENWCADPAGNPLSHWDRQRRLSALRSSHRPVHVLCDARQSG